MFSGLSSRYGMHYHANVKPPVEIPSASDLTPRRGPKTEQVYETLRDDIVMLRRAPGSFVDKAQVCEALGVSRFPVADALSRLAREKFIDIEPQRGSYVAPIRHGDVEEALFMRAALEEKAMRALGSRGLVALAPAMSRAMERQHAAVVADDAMAFIVADRDFHAICLRAVGFPRAMDIYEAGRAHVDRLRRFAVAPERWPQAIEEHERIVEAAERGDVDGATFALARHLEAVRGAIAARFDATRQRRVG